MKTYTDADLRKILEDHKHWLKEDVSGWANMRANLSGANLSGANLSRANLSGANLSGADLSRADLSGANLSGANLSGANLFWADLSRANLSRANLSGANLFWADLSRANLSRADLSRANLSWADLSGANLSWADLSGANLSRANLSRANLSRANLSGANLFWADLSRANLSGAENIPFIPYACPDFGSFIGFKKASGKIVVLEILDDAKRCSSTGRKCRCDRAKVLEIQNPDGSKAEESEVFSDYDRKFVYRIGEVVAVDNFDENRWNECAPGIHFFINRQEAVDYR